MQRDEAGAPVPEGAFEILIFANNCNDATADMARSFAALMPHPVKVIEEQLPPGTLSAGWPDRSDVAVTTRKGSGLAATLTVATNDLIASGSYAKILDHWHLAEEALSKSETNPPGLPKY